MNQSALAIKGALRLSWQPLQLLNRVRGSMGRRGYSEPHTVRWRPQVKLPRLAKPGKMHGYGKGKNEKRVTPSDSSLRRCASANRNRRNAVATSCCFVDERRMRLMLISHDLHPVARYCEPVLVTYGDGATS